jgi:hypothetical protein
VVDIHIPPKVRESVIASLGAFFEKINHVDRVILGNDHVDPRRYLENIEALNACVALRGKTLLEIGSGYGVSLAIITKQFHADATGIEPASPGFDDSFHGAREIMCSAGTQVLPVRFERKSTRSGFAGLWARYQERTLLRYTPLARSASWPASRGPSCFKRRRCVESRSG